MRKRTGRAVSPDVTLRKAGGYGWTVAQERYLLVLIESAAAGKLMTQKDTAERAHVSEKQVCMWKREPRWRDAVHQVLAEALRSSAWLAAEHAAAGRAARGSIRDWELYLLNGGPTSWRAPMEIAPGAPGAGAPNAVAGAVTHVHIHAIPEREPFSTLPPPLVTPVPAAPQSPAPAK